MEVMSLVFGGLAGAIVSALIGPLIEARLSKSLQERLDKLGGARERELAANMAYYDSVLGAHSMLAADPDLLELEGLTPDDFDKLQQARVSRKEAAYLFMSFKADARWHEMMNSEDRSPYREGEYRHTMLCLKKTRDAWKVLRKLVGNEVFIESMDKTVDLIEVAKQGKQSS